MLEIFIAKTSLLDDAILLLLLCNSCNSIDMCCPWDNRISPLADRVTTTTLSEGKAAFFFFKVWADYEHRIQLW